jgi:hypothetical protein
MVVVWLWSGRGGKREIGDVALAYLLPCNTECHIAVRHGCTATADQNFTRQCLARDCVLNYDCNVTHIWPFNCVSRKLKRQGCTVTRKTCSSMRTERVGDIAIATGPHFFERGHGHISCKLAASHGYRARSIETPCRHWNQDTAPTL